MAIFGRMTARQRLRRATRESLAIPAFSSPIDCTPWVTGGLWPAELSTVTTETATLAEYLKTDLQRIANGANDQLKMLKRAGMTDPARQAAEARVIEEARGRAVRRVESTIRYLHTVQSGAQSPAAPPPARAPSGADLEKTQVLPAVREVDYDAPPPPRWRRRPVEPVEPAAPEPEATTDEESPGVAEASHLEETQVIPVVTDAGPELEAPTESAPAAVEQPGEPVEGGRHHAPVDEPAHISQDAPDESAEAVVTAPKTVEKPTTPTRFDNDRLNRLLEFVVRQEPRLNWAIGDRADGTTVLVTDLSHGWIPSGISLPAGVRLLEPERRSGKVAALIGDTARVVTYAPGDSLRRSADFAATRSSVEPRGLPPIDDLPRVLSQVTRARAELPKIVTRLADAAAAGTFVVDQEVDVLRVHLDTARYQLLVQYPNVDPGLLLKCLLMAATEGIASGDAVSANYHLAWYQQLAVPTPGS